MWQIPEEVIQNHILKDYNVATDPQLDLKGIGHIIRRGLTGEKVEIPAILYNPEETGFQGRAKWVSGFMYPLRDQAGDVIEIILIHQDITEKKIAEEEVRKSRDQLQTIFEGVSDGILVQDTNYQPIYANQAAANICGFETPEKLCHATIPEIVKVFELRDEEGNLLSPDKLPARQALSQGKPQEGVVLRARNLKTGQAHWTLVSARPIYNDQGAPYLAVSIFREITSERQRQERANFLNMASTILANSLDYYETLNKIATLVVSKLADWCSIDVLEDDGPKTLSVAHNDPLMLKFAEELTAKYPKDWEAASGSPNVMRTGKAELYSHIPQKLLEKSAKSEEHWQMIKTLGLKSAMVVPLKLNDKILGAITFISAESGRVYDEIDLEMAIDLGQRSALALQNALLYRKSEKLALDLKKAVQARDEFISICSHELKTPITSLKLQYQITERKIKAGDQSVYAPENFEKRIASTNRLLDRMVKLIDEMLDVSRVNTGKLDMEEVELDLNELLAESLSRFKEIFESKNIQLNVELGESSCFIKGDRFRLDQVFTNIINNAFKYGNSKPIAINLIQLDKFARIEIKDQGIGIAPQDFDRIFNRFERVNSIHNISGLGLGLFISKQIILAHGGRIWVESEANQGTKFMVELPIIF